MLVEVKKIRCARIFSGIEKRVGFVPMSFALANVEDQKLLSEAMKPPKPKPITYLLMVQCIRPEIGVMAEYVASTPFPSFPKNGHLELLDCEPSTWDVVDTIQRITVAKDGGVFCATLLLADSPVVENSGFIVKKQSGEEVGPSDTRFGRIKN